jgi:hypothetical protein
MSIKHRLRTVLCCVVLEFAALSGMPMRPDEIRDLMHQLNVPKLAQTEPERDSDGDGPGS